MKRPNAKPDNSTKPLDPGHQALVNIGAAIDPDDAFDINDGEQMRKHKKRSTAAPRSNARNRQVLYELLHSRHKDHDLALALLSYAYSTRCKTHKKPYPPFYSFLRVLFHLFRPSAVKERGIEFLNAKWFNEHDQLVTTRALLLARSRKVTNVGLSLDQLNECLAIAKRMGILVTAHNRTHWFLRLMAGRIKAVLNGALDRPGFDAIKQGAYLLVGGTRGEQNPSGSLEGMSMSFAPQSYILISKDSPPLPPFPSSSKITRSEQTGDPLEDPEKIKGVPSSPAGQTELLNFEDREATVVGPVDSAAGGQPHGPAETTPADDDGAAPPYLTGDDVLGPDAWSRPEIAWFPDVARRIIEIMFTEACFIPTKLDGGKPYTQWKQGRSPVTSLTETQARLIYEIIRSRKLTLQVMREYAQTFSGMEPEGLNADELQDYWPWVLTFEQFCRRIKGVRRMISRQRLEMPDSFGLVDDDDILAGCGTMSNQGSDDQSPIAISSKAAAAAFFQQMYVRGCYPGQPAVDQEINGPAFILDPFNLQRLELQLARIFTVPSYESSPLPWSCRAAYAVACLGLYRPQMTPSDFDRLISTTGWRSSARGYFERHPIFYFGLKSQGVEMQSLLGLKDETSISKKYLESQTRMFSQKSRHQRITSRPLLKYRFLPGRRWLSPENG